MPGGMEAYLQREMEKVAWKKDTPISDGYGGYLIKYEGEWRRSLSHFYVDVDGIVRDGRHRPQKLDPTNSTGWFVDYDLMFKEQKVYKRYSMPTMLMARIALFKRKITRGLGF